MAELSSHSLRSPGEHRDPLAGTGRAVLSAQRPSPGPVTILPADIPPTMIDRIAAAVASAGGEVEALSQSTRALVWVGFDVPALEALLASHPGIGWVQLPLAGVEQFSDIVARHPHLLWTSAKGSFAEPVAEHALALTLAVLRDLPEKSRSATWDRARSGRSLYGCRVVIVGAGAIADEIIRLFAPFDVVVTVVRRSDAAVPGADRTLTAAHLLEAIGDADVVIVAAAATASTERMFSVEQFAAMKPGGLIVNIARGSLIDQDALVDALRSGHLSGAGLDVTTPEPLPDGHPLWTAPNVVITSHSANTEAMSEPLLAARVATNVAAMLGDGRFVGLVDAKAGY